MIRDVWNKENERRGKRMVSGMHIKDDKEVGGKIGE